MEAHVPSDCSTLVRELPLWQPDDTTGWETGTIICSSLLHRQNDVRHKCSGIVTIPRQEPKNSASNSAPSGSAEAPAVDLHHRYHRRHAHLYFQLLNMLDQSSFAPLFTADAKTAIDQALDVAKDRGSTALRAAITESGRRVRQKRTEFCQKVIQQRRQKNTTPTVQEATMFVVETAVQLHSIVFAAFRARLAAEHAAPALGKSPG
jgi:hypothetical protein